MGEKQEEQGSGTMTHALPHVTQFPADGRAHGGEGSRGLLSSLRQCFLSLFIPAIGREQREEMLCELSNVLSYKDHLRLFYKELVNQSLVSKPSQKFCNSNVVPLQRNGLFYRHTQCMYYNIY